MSLSTHYSPSPDEVSRALKAGRFVEVEECCKQVLLQSPETAWAWHFLGLLPGLDAESAIDFLTTALSLSPDNVQILLGLSRVYSRGGQFDLAEERAHQAVALQPNSAPAIIALAEAHTLAGQTDAAWSLWERSVVLAPSSFSAQFAYGQGLHQRGRSKEQIMLMKKT